MRTTRPGQTQVFEEIERKWSPSQPLDDYEILEVLGFGGLGTVNRAFQKSHRRMVALKRPNEAVRRSPTGLARMISGAETAACLNHPNIVQTYAIEKSPDQPFFALELVEGATTLACHLDRRAQPPVRVVAWSCILADAVHFAHGQGVLHLDLKPSNVLVDAGGDLKIVDFDLALPCGALPGEVFGTPSYMAPEIAEGNQVVSPAADVYSLGAIVYEMLTGRTPFDWPWVGDVLEEARGGSRVPPSEAWPGVPRELDDICLKCLQPRPEERYASAGELSRDLKRLHENWLRAGSAAPPVVTREEGDADTLQG